jgi:hypothetical protein
MANPELDKYVLNRNKGEVMDSIKFEISVEEANVILMALARQPFEQVVSVINKLQQQAQAQMPKPEKPNA